MKIVKSGATPSTIVELAKSIKRRSVDEGVAYLHLERGVHGVCPIDLQSILPFIDVNAPVLQTYPPSSGQESLKTAINRAYFGGQAQAGRIFVTPGSSMGLDLVFQTLDVDRVFLPEYHWGTYRKLLQIRRREPGYYASLEDLHNHPEHYAGTAVVLCDPNNPIGDLQPDRMIRETAERLGRADAAVIMDCPYRRVFFEDDDDFYRDLADLPNVIIVESFSKSLGLSGLRIGFVHASDADFGAEFSLRLALPTNGVDNFAQFAVEKLLAHPAGIEAARRFKTSTVADIGRNIAYLEAKGLLAGEFYTRSRCVGIFAVANRTADDLLAHRIGSISLAFFTATQKETAARFARINVSVPHHAFRTYFDEYLDKTGR